MFGCRLNRPVVRAHSRGGARRTKTASCVLTAQWFGRIREKARSSRQAAMGLNRPVVRAHSRADEEQFESAAIAVLTAQWFGRIREW